MHRAAALDASVRIQGQIEAEWAEVAGRSALDSTRTTLTKVLAAAASQGRAVPLRPTW